MKPDNILVIGKGFIGKRIKDEFSCKITDKKVYNFEDAKEIVNEYNPKVIINCVGYTGENNVDDCEKNIDKTLMANVFVPVMLGEVCLRNDIKLVHISSGCIYQYDYSEDKPIVEEKLPDYFNLFYSRSKIYSEQVLKRLAVKYPILIVRIRIPLDNKPHPKNILTKLINYKNVINVANSITYIPDFIKALKHLLSINENGIFNIVNEGSLRYPTLLEEYKKYVPDFKYNIIELEDLDLERTNLILSVEKLKNTGFRMRGISEVLEECVKNFLNY